ncbi:MAG: HlyD family efflux transporter periplasmic adaptor subunit [Pirellulaceae bacterium]
MIRNQQGVLERFAPAPAALNGRAVHRPNRVDETSFPALALVRSSRLARRLAWVLLVMIGVAIPAMLFAPWQQSVSGQGNVIAYAPNQRQQSVDAQISGIIADWDPEQIYEGARVSKGQVLMEINDVNPNMLQDLGVQRAATERELEANRTIVEAYSAQVDAFKTVREQSVAAADEYVKMAEQKVAAQRQKLDAEKAAEEQARFDHDRQKLLYDEGLASQLKMQLAERKWKEAVAKVSEAEANLKAAQNEEQAKRNERSAKEREAQAKIDSATALLRKAEADVAKVDKTLNEIDVKIAKQQSQVIKAPQDGFILKMLVSQGGKYVKAGDPLLILVPDTSDRVVELWLSGNDAPLVTPGREVRLQFEGWPAVQFVGWPSVAVGTFSGEVISVDATDNGQGQFRVLVRPSKAGPDWPSDRYLRQGVRANGWVMLNQVGLGYEMWRRLNGFPPVVSKDEPGGGKSSGAKKALGK